MGITESDIEYINSIKEISTNENAGVNGNVNDSYKRQVNFELTQSKQHIIDELKRFNYRTPPLKVSKLLEDLFIEYGSRPGHWLYIAQRWNPREINRNITRLIKIHTTGRQSIKNIAAYFTYLIKFRKKRKEFRNINDGNKQHE